jgi:threonine synthase
MDVGAPSNFERLTHLPPAFGEAEVDLVDDDAIRARLVEEYRATGYVWCPHSATAAEAYARLPDERKAERPWIAAATADPFKFADGIESWLGVRIEPPPALRAILGRVARKSRIPAELSALVRALEPETA